MLPLLLALAATIQVRAAVETEPMPQAGDAADDACIWVHPGDAPLSTVIGTNKQGGLAVYDLAGRQIQYLADGPKNNVDLRYGFPLGGRTVDVVVAGDTQRDALLAYRVDPSSRELLRVGEIPLGLGVYGTCLYTSPRDGALSAFVTNKSGRLEQWLLSDGGEGKVVGRRTRSLEIGGKIEGCVADDDFGVVYVAEESRGIWSVPAEADSRETPRLVDGVESGHLASDIEGLAILRLQGGEGYLIASSQGSDAFVIYERSGSHRYLGTFQVEAGPAIDGAEETDGIDATSASLGDSFPEGMVVVQNGDNDRGNQSFLLVPWHAVATPGGLSSAPGFDPRARPTPPGSVGSLAP